jgi:hypothetical protein
MTSLATVEALQWLAEALTRLTAAATCAAKRSPVNRAHSAHSPTPKGRLVPKSTVFSAFRLTRRVVKWLSRHPRGDSMLFEEPAPRMFGDKWGRGPKRTDGSSREDVRFGDLSLTVLRFWP